MKETISTIDVRQKLGDLLNRIHLRHDQFIIERKGKPLAAMVPVQKLEQMERAARLYLLEAHDRQGRKAPPLSQKEVDALANQAKHQTRKGERR